MALRLFTGSIEGTPYAAAHSLFQDEQFRAAVVIDFLSPGGLPSADESGWMSAAVDPDIPSETVIKRLGEIGDVEVVDATRKQAEAILGGPAVEALLDDSELFTTRDL